MEQRLPECVSHILNANLQRTLNEPSVVPFFSGAFNNKVKLNTYLGSY